MSTTIGGLASHVQWIRPSEADRLILNLKVIIERSWVFTDNPTVMWHFSFKKTTGLPIS